MSTTGLRERKKQQVRDTLVEVALSLFDARGFGAVTIDEIVEQAEVSQRTFFRYFSSKEAVLFADQDEVLTLVRASIRARPAAEPPLVALRHALAEITDHYAEHRDRHVRRARMAESGAEVAAYQRSEVVPQWEDALTEVVAHRLAVSADTDLRPRLLAGTAMAALQAVGRVWLAAESDADIIALLHEAFDSLEAAALEAARTR
ncbi:MAG: TetR family transcriptional regulator [Acidimicrobiales bacterium]